LSTVYSLYGETFARPVQGTSHHGRFLIKNGTISANLKEIPLGEILDQIKEHGNIWFKGDEDLLEEKVSVQFVDLPLEEGVKRILASINHVLLFDANGGLEGLILFGKANSVRDKTASRAGTHKRVSSSKRLRSDTSISSSVSPKKPSPAKGLDRDTAEGSFDTVQNPPRGKKPTAEHKVPIFFPGFHSSGQKPMVKRVISKPGSSENRGSGSSLDMRLHQ
jgi:hypothetical protein